MHGQKPPFNKDHALSLAFMTTFSIIVTNNITNDYMH